MNAQNVQIAFSLGQHVRHTQGLKQIRGTFDDLVAHIRPNGCTSKDGPYICGPMRKGRRSANAALPIAFAALDLDEIPNQTAFDAIVEVAKHWRCVVYTTSSHQPEKGVFRARIISELDREVSCDEYPQVCTALAADLELTAGVPVKFDKSCAKREQPLYTAREGAKVWEHRGDPVGVDSLLQGFTQWMQRRSARTPAPDATEADDDSFFGAPPSPARPRLVATGGALVDPELADENGDDWFEKMGQKPSGWTLDRVKNELLSQVSADCSYGDWLKVCCALHHHGDGAEDWFELFDEWSHSTPHRYPGRNGPNGTWAKWESLVILC